MIPVLGEGMLPLSAAADQILGVVWVVWPPLVCTFSQLGKVQRISLDGRQVLDPGPPARLPDEVCGPGRKYQQPTSILSGSPDGVDPVEVDGCGLDDYESL